MGLSLKKITKAVVKDVKQVAAVAVAPVTVAVAASADAAGLRHVANKVTTAGSLGSKHIANALKSTATAGGYAIDAGAVAVGGYVAAPYLASAATAVGHGIAYGGAALKSGIAKSLVGLIPSHKSAVNASNGVVDTGTGEGSSVVQDALRKAGQDAKTAFSKSARNTISRASERVASQIDGTTPGSPSALPGSGSSAPEFAQAGFSLGSIPVPALIISGIVLVLSLSKHRK